MISKLWLDVVKASFYGVKFLSTFFSFSNLILMVVAHLVIFWQYFKFMWQLLFVPYTEAKNEKKQKNENKILRTETATQRCCLGKSALKICSKFTGEHSCWSVISIKLQSNFIQITLRHGRSSVNLLYIFRRPFPKNTSGGLLMYLYTLFS